MVNFSPDWGIGYQNSESGAKDVALSGVRLAGSPTNSSIPTLLLHKTLY